MASGSFQSPGALASHFLSYYLSFSLPVRKPSLARGHTRTRNEDTEIVKCTHTSLIAGAIQWEQRVRKRSVPQVRSVMIDHQSCQNHKRCFVLLPACWLCESGKQCSTRYACGSKLCRGSAFGSQGVSAACLIEPNPTLET